MSRRPVAGRGMFSCEASRVDPSRRRDEIPIPSRQDNSPPRFHHLRLNSNCVEGLGNFPLIFNKWESVHRGQGVRRGSAGSDARVGALRTRRRCEYVPSVLIHLCEAYDVSNPTRNPSTLSPPRPSLRHLHRERPQLNSSGAPLPTRPPRHAGFSSPVTFLWLATDGRGRVGRELERERRVVAVSVGAAVVLVVLVVRGFGRVSFSLLRRAFARGGGARVDDGPHRVNEISGMKSTTYLV